MSTPSHLPALATDPKVVFFTDWDGTVTLEDFNDYLTDRVGMGYENRRKLNNATLDGTVTFRDAYQQMLKSIPMTFDEVVDVLSKNIQLDPGFRGFFLWARENNVPIVVVSSGMIPIIKGQLRNLVGPDAEDYIQIIANDVDVKEDGTWDIVFRDDSDFGHDKSTTLKPYAAQSPRPMMLYAGDGVSDLCAARETDFLFAREGRDLGTYCDREGIRYGEFTHWEQIRKSTEKLLNGSTIEKIAEQKL